MRTLVLVTVATLAAEATLLGGGYVALGGGLHDAGGRSPTRGPLKGSEDGDSCGGGQVRHVDGSCITPQVSRKAYVYQAPDAGQTFGPRPRVPPPKVEENVVLIHTAEKLLQRQPVVVPPPLQKTLVYLLKKLPQREQQVIRVPAPDQEAPQVFFVNYDEGENPSLPTGGDLSAALGAAVESSGELVTSGIGPDMDRKSILDTIYRWP